MRNPHDGVVTELFASASGPEAARTALMCASFAIMFAVSVIIPWLLHDRRLERRVFWTGWIVGAVGVAATTTEGADWPAATVIFGILLALGVLTAVRHTPYLKIGGRIIAMDARHRRPDDTVDDAADLEPAHRCPLTAEEARSATFRHPPIGQQGYDPDQVDALTDRIADTLDDCDDLTAESVRATTFDRAPVFRRGYDTATVDAFLDHATQTLSEFQTGTAERR